MFMVKRRPHSASNTRVMNPELLENPEISGADMMLLDLLLWLGTVSRIRLTDHCLTGKACQSILCVHMFAYVLWATRKCLYRHTSKCKLYIPGQHVWVLARAHVYDIKGRSVTRWLDSSADQTRQNMALLLLLTHLTYWLGSGTRPKEIFSGNLHISVCVFMSPSYGGQMYEANTQMLCRRFGKNKTICQKRGKQSKGGGV